MDRCGTCRERIFELCVLSSFRYGALISPSLVWSIAWYPWLVKSLCAVAISLKSTWRVQDLAMIFKTPLYLIDFGWNRHDLSRSLRRQQKDWNDSAMVMNRCTDGWCRAFHGSIFELCVLSNFIHGASLSPYHLWSILFALLSISSLRLVVFDWSRYDLSSLRLVCFWLICHCLKLSWPSSLRR